MRVILRNLLVFFLFFISGFVIFNYLDLSYQTKNKKYSGSLKKIKDDIYINCKNPTEVNLSFSSTILIHAGLGRFDRVLENPKLAVFEQLKYLQGYFYFKEQAAFKVLPKSKTDISIMKIINTRYKLPLAEDIKSFLPDFDYSKKTALQISYKVHKEAIICSSEAKGIPKSLEILLPLDPYLSYWNIRKNERVSKKFQNQQIEVNPCTSWRYLMLRDPRHHWYTWKPYTKGKLYSCTNLYSEKMSQIVASVRVNERKSFYSKKMNSLMSEDTISVSFIYGLINHKNTKNELRKIKEFLNKEKGSLLHWTDVRSLEKIKRKTNLRLDPSFYSLLTLLVQIKPFIKIEKINIKKLEPNIIMEFGGQFEGSGKRLVMNVFLGSTDDWVEENHESFLKESFQIDNFIFYIGHSGHGKNMSLIKKLGLSENELVELLNTKKFQHLSIISCFSTFYHDEEFLDYRKSEFESELVTVASEGYPFLFPTIVLQNVSEALRNNSSFLSSLDLSSRLGTDDIIIWYKK